MDVGECGLKSSIENLPTGSELGVRNSACARSKEMQPVAQEMPPFKGEAKEALTECVECR